jgi:hypothetical protein
MEKLRQLLIVFLLLLGTCEAHAQIAFTFVPQVQGRTVDGLLMARIVNTAAQKTAVTLTVTVTAQRVGRIVTIQTPPFEILPGSNALPAGLIAKSSIQFAANKLADVCRQSGYFMEGDYEYCFQLFAVDKQKDVVGEQCFDYFLEPFSPLLLVTPGEHDAICDKKPTLFWQPLLPAIPGMQYRLLLTEVKPGQAKVEALYYNMPIINQMNISMPMLFYPPMARELEEGKEYVWQVTAYKNDLKLADSEVWDFTISCKDSSKKALPESFRNIEDLTQGNFYLAKNELLFAVRNIYDKANLSYRIHCITKPDMKIRKLPVVKLERGINHITIDLSENRSFIDGYYYVLDVKLPNGSEKQLRFLYKKEQE